MTGIIIGLLAALGIGGGIALSSHGGGGSGDGDSGYTEPVQPENKPSIVSLLAAADKYQHIQSVSNYEGAPSIGNGIFTVTGERPVVENGKFKTDESYGEIEDVYEPYSTALGLENYSYSDAYADYYQKDSFVTKGLYNTKEYPGDADNWIELEQTTKDMLALGGQVLGLKNSEFGYHNNIQVASLGILPDYKPFYMYDDTKLATIARTDTALYKGNVLGYVEAENSSLEETLGEDIRPLTGNINLNINFANQTLNGSLDTKLSNKNWYGFNVSGYLSSLNSFSINSVSIDEAKHPDSALSKYNLMNISGAGGGKLLEDDTQRELVGNLWLSGNHTDSLIHADMSFGAIDTSKPQVEKPGEGAPSDPIQGPIPDYSLISALTDKEQYPDVKFVVPPNQYYSPGFLGNQEGYVHSSAELGNRGIILNTVKPVIHNGIFETHFEGGYDGIVNFQIDPVLLTHNHLIEENSYEKRYKESKSWTGKYNTNYGQYSKTVTRTNIVGMGGSKLGLTVSDFGYWDIDSNSIYWNYNSNYYYLYMYDNTKLAKNIQQDSAQLKGYVLPHHYEINMDFNFATNRVTGSVYNSITGSTLFDYSGDFYNAGFRIQSLSSYDGGQGVLLMGNDGLEAVGWIYASNRHYSFGAKEVK